MKCHFCKVDLTPLPYAEWKLKERKCIEYNCSNPKCRPLGNALSVVLNVILPDMKTQYYRILLRIKEKWYRLCGNTNEMVGGTPSTILSSAELKGSGTHYEVHETTIFYIERFYPINVSQDFQKQAEDIVEKLKTLNIFS